jgi:hypothetical protein
MGSVWVLCNGAYVTLDDSKIPGGRLVLENFEIQADRGDMLCALADRLRSTKKVLSTSALSQRTRETVMTTE